MLFIYVKKQNNTEIEGFRLQILLKKGGLCRIVHTCVEDHGT